MVQLQYHFFFSGRNYKKGIVPCHTACSGRGIGAPRLERMLFLPTPVSQELGKVVIGFFTAEPAI